MEGDQHPLPRQIPITVGGRIPNPEKHLSQLLRTIFDKACTSGPVTTVGERVEALAAQKWPGCKLLYNRRVTSSYLKEHATRVSPLFFVAPVGIFVMLYLRACCVEPLSEEDREVGPLASLALIARVAFLTSPEADYWLGFIPEQVHPWKVWAIEKAGPVSVQPSEWPRFQGEFTSALRHRLVSIGAQSYRYGLNETIYSLPDAERLATGLLEVAMPFPDGEGKVVAIHCNNPASMRELRAAEDVVTGGLPPDLEQELVGRLLAPKAAEAGRKSRVDEVIRTEQRDLFICLLKVIGMSNHQVARWLLEQEIIRPRKGTDMEDAVESAVRKVREAWNELGQTGPRPGDLVDSEEAST